MKITNSRQFLVVAMAASMSFVSNAAPPNWRSVDVAGFDIAGLKLGMSHGEVIEKIAQHLKLSAAEIRKLEAATVYSYSEATKNKRPLSLSYTKDGTSFNIKFSVRVPLDLKNPVTTSGIQYSIPGTSENNSALKNAAIEKYGPPSDDRRKSNLMWCENYNQIAQCEPLKQKLALILSSLTLSDPELDMAESKYIASQLTRKPNI